MLVSQLFVLAKEFLKQSLINVWFIADFNIEVDLSALVSRAPAVPSVMCT